MVHVSVITETVSCTEIAVFLQPSRT